MCSYGRVHKKLKVVIVGAGLVGSLESLFLAKRGYDVHLYEYREDIRKTPHTTGRSINLAMSNRARAALHEIGLDGYVTSRHGIPMKGRMIHDINGALHAIPYDAVTNQCIYSVSRRHLNETLLAESEKYENVTRHFNYKLIDANLKKGVVVFLRLDTGETLTVEADLIVGADGAFSSVRRSMMKQPLFDFSQQYIEHGYMELCIPPKNSQVMDANFLHIWPRGSFMMIALPNQDCSWTVTLFMPYSAFCELSSPDALLQFFATHFPDCLPLLDDKQLVEDYFASRPSYLLTVKCRPYNVAGNAVIIGDAAHAMVPFYGQGMNSGFEDCLVLDRILDKHGEDDMLLVLEEFSRERWVDAHAISDLAIYNYIEMRDLVNRRSYRLRKKLDDVLFSLFPKSWVPLYNSVTFSQMRYSDCVRNRQWQDKLLLTVTLLVAGFAIVVALVFGKQINYNIFS